MKKIMVSQGQETLVDDEDFKWLNKWKWCASKQRGKISKIVRNTLYSDGKKRPLLLHRLIMGLQLGDKKCVDHINGNPLDNRRRNLRICTNAQNSQNKGKNKNNTSGYKGVSWYERSRTWRAAIGYQNKDYELGFFSTPEEAALVYNKAALKYHGEFAYQNDVLIG